MRLIPLTQGKFAKVDDADFDWLNQWNWCAHRQGNNIYAVRNEPRGPGLPGRRRHHIKMHALLAGKGADHADGDGLNNRRYNLRPASKRQNAANSRKYKNNTSGYRGVAWHKQFNRWQVLVGGQYVGRFVSKKEAARAYDKRAKQIFGEFAKLNFP